MLEQNVEKLIARLKPEELVLDVGGWACPFNRAQWIIDAEPYETRGFYRTFGGASFQGPEEEWFTKQSWIQRDLCEHHRWPFSDKQFDFVICSHTLEDLRDPLWVCSEMIRVGKAGYIEVPSRAFESCLGVERPGQAGLSHHRWLVEINNQHIRFLQKFHMIHADWRFSLPAGYRKRLTTENSVAWLWWENHFTFEEVQINGLAEQEAELAAFVSRVHPHSPTRIVLDSAWRSAKHFPRRVISYLKRKVKS